MPEGVTGKQLASRIPLDYHKRRNPVERWKHALALTALVAAVGWVLFSLRVDGRGVALSDFGQRQASRGPVAKVH